MLKRNLLTLLCSILALVGIFFGVTEYRAHQATLNEVEEIHHAAQPTEKNALESNAPSRPQEEATEDYTPTVPKSQTSHSAPFVSQAPFGDWADPRQQDGCEEASLLMAVRWARDESLTPEEALTEIHNMARWQQERFGFFEDTSVDDSAIILDEYFQFQDYEVQHDITLADIDSALKDGALVLVPVDGRKLHNPYFTPPGPDRHMIVVIDYNLETREFITHDPGTKRGEHFRYSRETLQNALHDYPSGKHEMSLRNTQSLIRIEKES